MVRIPAMSMVENAAQLAPDTHYLWEASGHPFSIRLSRSAAERILADSASALMRRRGVEVGGVLLGTRKPGAQTVINIEDVEPVPCEYAFGSSFLLSDHDCGILESALERLNSARDARFRPVGFYRTHTRDRLSLSADDLLVMGRFFADPADVALLVRPSAMRPSSAGFFVWEDGTIRSEASYLEFTIKPRRNGGREQPDTVDVATPDVAAADVPLPSFLSAGSAGDIPKEASESPGKGDSRRGWWTSLYLQAPLFLCLMAAAGVLGFDTAKKVDSRPQLAARDPYSLALRVVEYGENVQLTWDRTARAIGASSRGVLAITDGEQNRTVDLTAGQLAHGSVIYRRISPRVRFRLEVFVQGRNSVAETIESGAGTP
jgi:hypothetical protein